MRRRRATVATPGEWLCKTGGVRRLAVANGPNIFQMLLVSINSTSSSFPRYIVAYFVLLQSIHEMNS